MDKLKDEFELLYDYVKRYIAKSTPEKCWHNIFNIGHDLGVSNIIHLIEICLVIPLSNAESEHFFQEASVNE